MTTTPHRLSLLLIALAVTASAQSTMPAAGGSIDELVARLGADDYEVREAATRELLGGGVQIRDALNVALRDTDDPEVRRRLRYVIENIVPPKRGVLAVRCASHAALRPGDLITHVTGRRVHNVRELQAAMPDTGQRVELRIATPTGPREIVVDDAAQLQAFSNYRLPHGPRVAEIVRLYAGGYAEQAYERLLELAKGAPSPITEDELSAALRAQIAFTAGDRGRALELLADATELVEPVPLVPWQTMWDAPSSLDLHGPLKAPYALEWAIGEQAQAASYNLGRDPDLRVQRVLVPARRYIDALVRAAELWWHEYRPEAVPGDEATRRRRLDNITQGGNMLAVVSWMCHELDLRSECQRLIEPRSVILRQPPSQINKWVRVDTDAWLPFLAGRPAEALDQFFPDARDVLAHVLPADDTAILTRNPAVAARVAFFLYQFPNDARVMEMLRIMSVPRQRGRSAYAYWMCMALRPENAEAVREHLAVLLPGLPRADAPTFARALALLEYTRDQPRDRIFASAREYARDDAITAEIDVLRHLAADRVEQAAAALSAAPAVTGANALRSTIDFIEQLSDNDERPLLAVPIDMGTAWILVMRDHRLMRVTADGSSRTRLAPPTPSWYAGPLNWPWLGYCRADGSAWAYGRRRVIELGVTDAVRLNIHTTDIPAFDRYVGPVFAQFAADVRDGTAGARMTSDYPEMAEFLRADIRAGGEYVSDPDLPEIGWIAPIVEDKRIVHVALRGGPQFLIETAGGSIWSSAWIAERLQLATLTQLFPRGLCDRETPVFFLTSDQGLIRFDIGQQEARRIALPGDDPYPALIPETMPYDRRDKRWVYFARPPEDGGQVYRLKLVDGAIAPLDLVNLALPEEYHAVQTRAALRAEIDERMVAAGLPPLLEFIDHVTADVSALASERD